MTANAFVSPVEKFKFWVKENPEAVYLRQPKGSQWKTTSWAEAYSQVLAMASYLSKFPEGTRIAIYSLNCAQWIIADLAILISGHISVPIYPTASSKTVSQILEHSGASLVFIGKLSEGVEFSYFPDELEKIAIFGAREGMPFWDNVLATVVEQNDDIVAPDFEAKETDIATLVYTSGTTGHPKGVMLSYRALFKAMDCVRQNIQLSNSERFFSYLPLAHIAERMVVEINSFYFGGMISFVESLDHFSENLKQTQPTVFFGVPRIWVKLMQGVQKKLGGASVSSTLMTLPVLGKLLKKKIIKGLGFGQVKFAISAAAAISPEVLRWFQDLGLEIVEVYGLSETTGISHMNVPGKIKIGSVGKAIPETDFQLTESGEILIRSPNLMTGYYNAPDLTDAAIQDGWFRTGDLGKVDDEGYLTITGRAKEIFKTSKGKYISPSPIESKLQPALGVEQLLVAGAELPQPIVIAVVLDKALWKDRENAEKQLNKLLTEVNSTLEKHEQLSHLIVVADEWTIETGMMTPTLKLRRQQIEDHYQSVMQQLKKTQRIVWIES